MKLGLQTISFGPKLPALATTLGRISDLGFDGVEFAQRVETFGLTGGELRKLLDSLDLVPCGLAGGSLQNRLEYAETLLPEYLYIDEWDEPVVRAAMDRGFVVALHPHFYKDIETISLAERYLQTCPDLRLILDTAHAALAGDDCLAGLGKHLDRVAAIHFKDWNNRHDRSPLRFARGFCALGRGSLGSTLELVLRTLVDANFQGWLIVEQDTSYGDPLDCAKESLDWLCTHGLELVSLPNGGAE